MLRIVVPAATAVALLGSISATAQERPGDSRLIRPGDVIPRSTLIIGVDGESQPKPYGLVIHDGKHIALVEAKSRKVIEVTSDQPQPSVSSVP